MRVVPVRGTAADIPDVSCWVAVGGVVAAAAGANTCSAVIVGVAAADDHLDWTSMVYSSRLGSPSSPRDPVVVVRDS